MKESDSAPRTVLVLGGGGMKGMAHIGVWAALETRGIRPDAIVGTSVGALIGALIASGMPTRALEAMARDLAREDVVGLNARVRLPGGVRQSAIFTEKRYRALLATVLPPGGFSDLTLPLRINAVSLDSGAEFWFGAESPHAITLEEAVYASSALPLYFPPLAWSGEHLADGALRQQLAIREAVRWGAQRIIASDVRSDLQPAGEGWIRQGLVAVHERMVSILADRVEREDERLPAEIIRIRPDIGQYAAFDFEHTDDIVRAGRAAARIALRALPSTV